MSSCQGFVGSDCARGLRYPRERMYAASAAFRAHSSNAFLRGRTPKLLNATRSPLTLFLDIGRFSGPPELGEPAQSRPIKFYNPSIVAAPDGLCPRCAFVAAVRADALHQCDRSSPLFRRTGRIGTGAFFKGSAIVVLDSQLHVIRWTWFISQPQKQVSTWTPHPRTHVAAGVSDGYAPPWAQQVYDMRLLNVGGKHLFATYNCVACKFSISKVHLTRQLTADGGLKELRSWASYRHSVLDDWLQGRNQALFVTPSASQPSDGTQRRRESDAAAYSILIQPWIGIVGSLGAPTFARQTHFCYGPKYDPKTIAQKHVERIQCGPTPRNTTVTLEQVSNIKRGYGIARLLLAAADGAAKHHSAAKSVSEGDGPHGEGGSRIGDGASRAVSQRALSRRAAALADAMEAGAPVGAIDAGGARISATANLLPLIQPSALARRGGSGPTAHMHADGTSSACVAYVGIGHLHRGEGELNRRLRYLRSFERIQRRDGRGRGQGRSIRGRGGRGGRGRGSRGRSGGLRVDGALDRSSEPGMVRSNSSSLPPTSRRLHEVFWQRRGTDVAAATAFKFGHHYTHFFYALSPVPPHTLIATSGEFCIASAQDPRDCESVQFVSGLELVAISNLSMGAAGSVGLTRYRPLTSLEEKGRFRRPSVAQHEEVELLLSYGVNDCEAKVATIPLNHLWEMLEPLASERGICHDV